MLADDHVPRAHSPSWDPSSPCAAEEAGPGRGGVGAGEGGCHGHTPVQRGAGQREVQMQACEAAIHAPSSLTCSHVSEGLILRLSSELCFPDGRVLIFAFELVLICHNPGLPKLD